MVKRSVSFLASASLLVLAACSPTLDWREVQPQGSGAVAMFPCRPSHERREVRLAGGTVALSIVACHAGDAMYALSYGDVSDPGRVGAALEDLRRSALGNLQGVESVERPLQVPGMTPHPQARGVEATGDLPDGRHVTERLALFSKGTRVFQATLFGPSLPPEAVESFLGGLRLP